MTGIFSSAENRGMDTSGAIEYMRDTEEAKRRGNHPTEWRHFSMPGLPCPLYRPYMANTLALTGCDG